MISNMAIEQCLSPGMMIEVIQFKIEYRFTDVFDKHSFGEAYFAGTMRKIATATAEGLPIKNGIGWEAQVSQMPKPRDWDDINNKY